MHLNESQKRHLLHTFEYIDQLLVETEQILSSPHAGSLFPKYFRDTAPDRLAHFKHEAIEFRRSMREMLGQLGIQSHPSGISAQRAALTNLAFADIALDELKSKHTRGYGELTPADAQELDDRIARLRRLLTHISERLSEVGAKTAPNW
ncbi:MAG: hypothetical protein M0036_25365 [Desulfobacteraceae bacterium]|nr:hypothetical protein [Desulfobacteraceae bacterium]